MTAVWTSEDLAARLDCPGCGARPNGPLLARRGDGLPVRACGDCGLIYVDPAPNEAALAARYGSGYFTGESDFFHGLDYCELRDRAIVSGGVTGFREIASNIELKDKSILEIGCATGALLQSLKRFAPLRMVGIDLAESAVEFGRKRYGLDLRVTTLERAGFDSDEFDLIILVDLIEHVPGLAEFVGRMVDCLKPDGLIYLSTPDAGGLHAAGDNWCHLFVNFEHVHYLSAESLDNLAQRQGLEVVKSWSEGYPVTPRQYRFGALPRMLRIALEPHTAIHNTLIRFRYRHAAARGQGAQLNAILRRPAGE